MAKIKVKGRKAPAVVKRPTLLWIGDAGCNTGFATVSHNILTRLAHTYDIHVLAVNYYGDPHELPLKLYPTYLGRDVYGVGRLKSMMESLKPDVVCILNDPWVVRDYLDILKDYPQVVRVCYSPVDSPNVVQGFATALNTLDAVISYTEFGASELNKAGTVVPLYIVPHGLNTQNFHPMGKLKARQDLKIPEEWFIVGCVNRNQPRKRIDLALQAFALFAKDKPEARFFYHGALNDVGWDIPQLAHYFGVYDKLMITGPNMTSAHGVPVDVLNKIYNAFDMFVSTTLGEGWGLTNMEAAACKIPQIVPKWSALGEWLSAGALQIPCTSIMVNNGGINTIGGVVDMPLLVEAMNKLYHDPALRKQLGQDGYALVRQEKFSWDEIARSFDSIFREVAHAKVSANQQGVAEGRSEGDNRGDGQDSVSGDHIVV